MDVSGDDSRKVIRLETSHEVLFHRATVPANMSDAGVYGSIEGSLDYTRSRRLCNSRLRSGTLRNLDEANANNAFTECSCQDFLLGLPI